MAQEEKLTRRLAAILAADIVGYSALMGRDDEVTLGRLKKLRREVLEPIVAIHRGRIFKSTGDGVLVEFASPVEAARCAVEVQETLSRGSAENFQLRIGISLGDVIAESDGDIYGEGVNLAARLEQVADPGGVIVSGNVYDEVRGKLPVAFHDRGSQRFKNIAHSIRTFAVSIATRPPVPFRHPACARAEPS
jgi:adenylate cyclase